MGSAPAKLTKATLLTCAILLAISANVALTSSALGQTFQVIHNFQGPEGDYPTAGLTMDRDGNFYGTAFYGGFHGSPICIGVFLIGCGTVFELSKYGSVWMVTPIFIFTGLDGANPEAPVTFGPDGALYGSTGYGGESCVPDEFGCGTIFGLTQVPSAPAGPGLESLIFKFPGGADGGPLPGPVAFDGVGRMYGSSGYGGAINLGVVFEFTRSGNTWTQSIVYTFQEGNDGNGPEDVIPDPSGDHLLGVTGGGGGSSACHGGCGTIYELTRTDSGWTETILHAFNGEDGALPSGATVDKAGNLYGTTKGGYNNPATVWELARTQTGWTFNLLYTFVGQPTCGPYSSVAIDSAGSLYGTTYCDGSYHYGTVYKLAPSPSGWIYTDLHDFTGGEDGGYPVGPVTLDSSGNLYGTTTSGGQWQVLGVIWEITR